MTKQTLAWAVNKLALRRRVVIASVVQTSGSVPGKVGARLAVAESSDGFHGTIGGAGLELKVLNRCIEILEKHFEPFGEVQAFGLNKSAKGYEVQPLDSLCGGRSNSVYRTNYSSTSCSNDGRRSLRKFSG